MAARIASSSQRSPKLCLLTNILSPYRAPVYRRIGEVFETILLLSGTEDNRNWGDQSATTGLAVKHVWGFTRKRVIRDPKGLVSDLKYTHINPGYLLELLRNMPDAVISTEMGFRSLCALLYGMVFRKPVWVWWGGTLHTERNVAAHKRLLRRVFARIVPRWISYGKTSTAYLRSIGISDGNILEIQNCVDDSLFRCDGPVADLAVTGPKALFVGQLIDRKGIFHLLDSLGSLIRAGSPPCSLVIVGDGPERQAVLSRAHDLGIEILHIPKCPNQDMPAIYRACDFLVFPTLEDVWGLVVNEAILCGLAVLSSVYAGCTAEIVPPSNRFDPLDTDSFTNALRRAIGGELAPPDSSCLLATGAVAMRIAEDVKAHAQIKS